MRYAKNLYDRGKKSEAKRIVSGLLKSKDDTVLSEAIYSQIVWGFASNDRESFEKLKAYYPDFKWLESTEKAVVEREKLRRIEEEEHRKSASMYGKIFKQTIRYVKYSNGIVFDKATGLEWYAGPDKNIDWYKAKDWVSQLNVMGGGWRMPTINELGTLYVDSIRVKSNRSGNITPLLKVNGSWLWSGDSRDQFSAWSFDSLDGKRVNNERSETFDSRIFAVRKRK